MHESQKEELINLVRQKVTNYKELVNQIAKDLSIGTNEDLVLIENSSEKLIEMLNSGNDNTVNSALGHFSAVFLPRFDAFIKFAIQSLGDFDQSLTQNPLFKTDTSTMGIGELGPHCEKLHELIQSKLDVFINVGITVKETEFLTDNVLNGQGLSAEDIETIRHFIGTPGTSFVPENEAELNIYGTDIAARYEPIKQGLTDLRTAFTEVKKLYGIDENKFVPKNLKDLLTYANRTLTFVGDNPLPNINEQQIAAVAKVKNLLEELNTNVGLLKQSFAKAIEDANLAALVEAAKAQQLEDAADANLSQASEASSVLNEAHPREEEVISTAALETTLVRSLTTPKASIYNTTSVSIGVLAAGITFAMLSQYMDEQTTPKSYYAAHTANPNLFNEELAKKIVASITIGALVATAVGKLLEKQEVAPAFSR